MTDLRNQVRLASEILGVGRSRVWIDPLHTDDVAEAVTRADVRKLIHKGTIKAAPTTGVSRARANKIALQKEKGRRRGPGSRKGAKGARSPRKARWIRTIRPQREVLRTLRETKAITPAVYRVYYLKAKGGSFRSRAHLVSHMKTDGVLAQDVSAPVAARARSPPANGGGNAPAKKPRAKKAKGEKAEE